MATSGGSLAVLNPGSKNCQRLGSLLIVAALAPPSRSIDLQSLADSYRELITVPFPVPAEYEAEMREYLTRRNLARKYSAKVGAPFHVEVQDWLLADRSLPSSTGAEKEETRPTIDLAVQLGLLWPGRFQRSWYGELLVAARDIVSPTKTGDRSRNPFALTADQRMFFWWAYVERDGAFLRYLLNTIAAVNDITIPVLIERISTTFSGFVDEAARAASGPDKPLVQKLNELRSRIGRQAVGRVSRAGGVTAQTLRRDFEELLYWRLEALVDIGLLKKNDRLGYVYALTAAGDSISAAIRSGLNEFRARFFSLWRTVIDGVDCTPATGGHALDLLREANSVRANAMGYTLIDEALLVANAQLMQRRECVILERDAAIQALTDRSEDAYRVITSVDKNRRLSAFKIVTNDGG